MRRIRPSEPRPRRWIVACLVVLAFAVASVPAIALGATTSAATAPAAEITELAPIDAVPDAPGADSLGSSNLAGGASLGPEEEGTGTDATGATPSTGAPEGEHGLFGNETSVDAPAPEGSLAQLRALRVRLDAERSAAQDRLLELEAVREQAEEQLDAATDAIATRLVDLLEADEQERLAALIAIRDADSGSHEELLDSLVRADYLLVVAHDRASDAVDAAAERANAVRSDVLALGTRIAALDSAIAQRTPMTADQKARASGKRYSIDADYVFATGPIPGIGYWGAMGGGTMLSGWSGYAGAALGGVGCTAPDPALKATGSIEQGEASWYGPGFDKQATASGETYDQMAMTAAHNTLPFGTIVRVTSSATGRCAFVRINDRGPFVDGRIIDLSRAAATAIGMDGTAPVQLEVWAAPGGSATAPAPVS